MENLLVHHSVHFKSTVQYSLWPPELERGPGAMIHSIASFPVPHASAQGRINNKKDCADLCMYCMYCMCCMQTQVTRLLILSALAAVLGAAFPNGYSVGMQSSHAVTEVSLVPSASTFHSRPMPLLYLGLLSIIDELELALPSFRIHGISSTDPRRASIIMH